MRITKLGHCCLLIEEQGLRVLTDPGFFTAKRHGQEENLDLIIITHEHGDHFHLDSLKPLLSNNPQAKIVTNSAVGKLLAKENLAFQILEHGQSSKIGELLVEGFGNEHAEIYDQFVPRVQNTGYLIGKKLYYPGDAFYVPETIVEVLALPSAGPWMKLKDAVDFAKQVKPKKCFPVHDAVVAEPVRGLFNAQLKKFMGNLDIQMVVPEGETVMEF